MKLKSKFNLIIDVLMFLFLLPVFFGRGHFHEVFGWITGCLFIIHILLHWVQIKCLLSAWFPKKSIQILITTIFIVVSVIAVFLTMQKTKEYQAHKRERFQGNNFQIENTVESP